VSKSGKEERLMNVCDRFFFIVTTVIAGLVVRADRKKAKRAAAVVSVSVVPGRVEAAA
jgi:hypothetical protein